jgi:RimJ/RimL family protein N-acetyltransferase
LTELVVRELTADDRDRWLDVLESVAREGRWIGTEAPVDRASRIQGFLEGLQDGSRVHFGIEIDGELVGVAGLDRLYPGLYDLGVMVLDGWRGRGIGQRLVEACIERARREGAYKIQLQAWPHNTAAIRLYERFGFEREGFLRKHWRRKDGELWDSVVMGLLLE